MRSLRPSTVLMLGAALTVAAACAQSGDQEAAAAEKRLFAGLEADDVAWIELEATGGEGVRAERSDGRWELVEPLRFPGDAAAWDGIASTLATLAVGGHTTRRRSFEPMLSQLSKAPACY